jgi:hypothetical protein
MFDRERGGAPRAARDGGFELAQQHSRARSDPRPRQTCVQSSS